MELPSRDGRYAKMSVLEVWYAKVAFDDLLKETASDVKLQKLLRKSVDKATQSTAEHVFHKLTVPGEDGDPRIVAQPPLLFQTENHERTMQRDMLPFFARYRGTLPTDRRALFDRYRIVDAAYKVVGVGSVGTRCFVILLIGDQNDSLFLQAKEARASVLEGRAGPNPFAHNGERVVVGQRLMQSASDIFLGWTAGPRGREFYVRQLRDMKVAPDITAFTPRALAAFGRLCGKTLARAHAKSGDAATISGYLGSAATFDEAIAGYAVAYADQVEEDYESFARPLAGGDFRSKRSPRKPKWRFADRIRARRIPARSVTVPASTLGAHRPSFAAVSRLLAASMEFATARRYHALALIPRNLEQRCKHDSGGNSAICFGNDSRGWWHRGWRQCGARGRNVSGRSDPFLDFIHDLSPEDQQHPRTVQQLLGKDHDQQRRPQQVVVRAVDSRGEHRHEQRQAG
jgi:hypothetical protein